MNGLGYGLAGSGMGGAIAFVVLRRWFEGEAFGQVHRMAMLGVLIGMLGGGISASAAANGNSRTSILSLAITALVLVLFMVYVTAAHEAGA